MTKIVGRKIETSLTFQRVGDGSRNVLVTKHAVVTELHATKGWRTIARHKDEQTRRGSPSREEVKAHTATVYEARR